MNFLNPIHVAGQVIAIHPTHSMWARSAQDDRTIEEWHFNILGLKVSADDAAVTKSYRAQILLAHPDRNMTGVNTAAKTQMLNEARTLLLNKTKRLQFEKKWTTHSMSDTIKKNDIVKIHSLSLAKYNYIYGRVVSDNLAEEPIFNMKYTIQPLHLHSQYDTRESKTKDGECVNIVWGAYNRAAGRVYGDPERVQALSRWSKYFAKDDRVTIKNVEEAPWYNETEATIVGYNNDLMRFDVLVDGKTLSLMPHNLYLLQQPAVRLASPARVASPVRSVSPAQAASPVRSVSPAQAASPGVTEPAASDVPGGFQYSVGETVEVRWKNAGQDVNGKARRFTWHVAVIIVINFKGDAVSSYDVEMPDTFTKQPGAILREVCCKHLHKRRKRGKRLKAGEEDAESGGAAGGAAGVEKQRTGQYRFVRRT
jgi:hypothetical protein